MNLQTLYWFSLIKICRFLVAIRLPGAAEWIGEHSGLTARLKAMLDAS